MNLAFIVVFAISIVAATTNAQPPKRGCGPIPMCGINEVFRVCGSDCAPRCFDKRPCPTTICVPRCMCKEGYIRNSAGACVLFANCS